MDNVWIQAENDHAAETLLVQELGIHRLTARLLANRGLKDPGAAEMFLRPSLSQLHDPFALPDMDKAARRIADAVNTGETIFVHGDYDVDGVTSTALYVRALTKLGATIIHRVPHRHNDGYDLKVRALQWAKDQGASLVITTDCGIQAREAVGFANGLGMTVIITDHHEPGETLPDAYAVVNPHRCDSTYPFTPLAGVGVAYKTMQAVTRLLKPEWEAPFQLNFLDLVATGTVADVMPLLGENRVFALFGLEALRKTRKIGLKMLLEGAGIDVTRKLSSDAVGFGIGPRINAVGRLDDATIALDLLLTTDMVEAQRLVTRLNDCNQERQQTQRRVVGEAVLKVVERRLHENPVVVVASKNWNPGVVGIVAGKLVEQFNRPSIVVSISEDGLWGKGSARSIPALNIFQTIGACRDILDTCGGHAFAAGLSLQMDQYDTFYERICAYAGGLLTEEDFRPQVRLDAQVALGEIDMSLLEEWEQMEPFGAANPQPMLSSTNLSIGSCKRIGKDYTHLKLAVGDPKAPGARQSECVAWNKAKDWEQLAEGGNLVDIAYVPSINSFNGRRSVQLSLKDLRESALP